MAQNKLTPEKLAQVAKMVQQKKAEADAAKAQQATSKTIASS